MTPAALTPVDLAAAAGLLLASAALSLVLALGVHRQMLVAACRMVVQLALVGLLLRFLFSSPWLPATIAVALAMLLAAAREVGARSRQRLRGAWTFAIGLATVVGTTLPLTVVVLLTALRPVPWYDARQAIPLLGMILGTVLNAGSLALNAVFATVVRERRGIEARLALGATRLDALRPILRQAVLTAVIPTVNQMAAAGIITLPGLMTGQVLAGVDPLQAAEYQMLLMFALAAGGFCGGLIAAYAALRRLSDGRHRLRLDRLG